MPQLGGRAVALANITDGEKRTRANRLWKDRIQSLADMGKEEDADAIKSWLRSQYAHSIRERKRGAIPQDFDLIGTEFHRWVRDHEERLDLEPGTAGAAVAAMTEKEARDEGRCASRLPNAYPTGDAVERPGRKLLITLVEPRGFEPLTSAVRLRRSPN